MKFIVSSALLQKQLASINGAVPNNPVIPILENFLFDIKDGVLTASATDLNVSMITQINVDTEEEGGIAVPAKILIDTLKSLPEQPVEFTIDEEKNSIEIKANSGRYKLSGESPDDFPKIPQAENPETAIHFSSAFLQNALSRTLYAVGTDEMRPAMSGVLMEFVEEGTIFVSTDSHRLIRLIRDDIERPEKGITVIIPKKALTLLKSILPNEDTEVQTAFDGTNAFFNFGSINMVARLIDENYPDYRSAIPQDNPNKLIISRVETLNSLKRLIIYANKTTNQIRLKLFPTSLQILAEDIDYSNEAQETLICEYEGEEMEVGFNARFLIDAFSNLDCDEVSMSFSTPSKAVIIRPQETIMNEDILILVMPVMLSSGYY